MKVPDAFQKLIDNVESTMRHAIVEEEHIPMETVTNFDEVGHVRPRQVLVLLVNDKTDLWPQ